MYDGLARRYDRVNRIISWGQDRRWRAIAVRDLPPEGLLADLGGGTGEMTLAYLRRQQAHGFVVLVDFNRAMVRHAQRKIQRRAHACRVRVVIADVERLPFRAKAFAGAMSAFVLRNLPGIDGVARETYRVLTADGRAVFLDATRPPAGGRRALFDLYFQRVMPWFAALLGNGQHEAYRYLAASVNEFPSGKEVARQFAQAGFPRSEFRPLWGGMATLFSVSRAAPSDANDPPIQT